MIFKKDNFEFFLDILRRYRQSLHFDFYCLTNKFRGKENDLEKIFIRRLYFGVTNICNLRCCFCAYSKKYPQKLGIMKFDVFKKAIDEFNKLGGGIVSFTPTVGEALLDPGLITKIKYALSLPSIKEVYFYSNGTLLSKNDNYKKLIDIGINKIVISLSACDREIFKKITQVDLYDQTIEGIHKLLEYNLLNGEKTKIEIHFRSPVLPSRVIDSQDFQKYIKPYLGSRVSYSFMSRYDSWCGNISNRDLHGVMRLRRVNRFKYLPCIKTYDAVVLFDGSIRLCACRIKDGEFDELVIGNIKDNSLNNLFYSPKARSIRESFTAGKYLPACEKCSLYIPVTNKFISLRSGKGNLE